MKTIYDFIKSGNEEQRYLAVDLKTCINKEKELEKDIERCREFRYAYDFEKSKSKLNRVRYEITSLLELARLIGMDDSDFVLLNYKQYTGESVVEVR